MKNNNELLDVIVSVNYSRIRDNFYKPTLTIDSSGSAHIGNSTINSTPGDVWHGTAIEFDTNRLTAEMIKDIYNEVGKISWETRWNGSNHVGCEKSEDVESKIQDVEDKIRDMQMNISTFAIDQCDSTTLLEEQTIIKEWSELNEDNIEDVAGQIHESMFNYEDDYQIYVSDARDVESAIRDYAETVK